MKVVTNLDLNKNQLLNTAVQSLSSAPSSPVAGQIYYDTTKNQFGVYCGATSGWIYLAAGTGTVTTVSVASANGFSGTVANATTTPAITMQTTVTGLLKGNGTAVSAATSGTDYAPATSGSSILKGNGSGGFSNAVANTDYAPVASPTFTGTVTVPSTVNATDAAQKQYVDAAVQGLSAKLSARCATVGTETFTITSGSVTQISGTTVDGVSPAVGDLILVKDAPAATGTGSAGSNQPGNGLYSVTNATTNLTISRAADLSGSNAPAGAYVFVEAGTVNASAGYVVSAPSSNTAFTYGSGSIQFTQFSGAGEITAGTALSKTGNTLNVSTVPLANGGTGQTSQQAAMDALAGAQTSGSFLRGNGTHVTMQPLQAADVPSNTGSAPGSLGTGQKIAVVYNSGAIGDGSSTSLAVNHNLNNAIPMVTVYDVSGSYPVEVICDVAPEHSGTSDNNWVTLTFASAPASNSIKCVIVG